MLVFLLRQARHHPSAILLVVQLLGIVLYPFLETTHFAQIALNLFGILVLGFTVRMVRVTPGSAGVSAALAVPVVTLTFFQLFTQMAGLEVWVSGLEAMFYFHAAASLITYMMADNRTTTDELFAAAATFTLLVWGFTHLFIATQALQPTAFSPDGTPRSWTDLNHLSFALLSSTGMGNVVAISSHAQALASIEMMTGVFFLATVVARLIGFTIVPANDAERDPPP